MSDAHTLPFFSIVIPAHNEESYIADTLHCVQALEYPTDRYEVLVIENGSTDATLERAKAFETSTVRVIHSETRGVSAARNLGSSMARPSADWILFLDADTHPRSSFLRDLGVFLLEYPEKDYVVGVFSIQPAERGIFNSLFFVWGNITRRFTKLPYTTFVIRRNLFPKIALDESLEVAEDVMVCREAEKFGSSFFFPTKALVTSTRRFNREGYIHMSLLWLKVMFASKATRERMLYKIVR